MYVIKMLDVSRLFVLVKQLVVIMVVHLLILRLIKLVNRMLIIVFRINHLLKLALLPIAWRLASLTPQIFVKVHARQLVLYVLVLISAIRIILLYKIAILKTDVNIHHLERIQKQIQLHVHINKYVLQSTILPHAPHKIVAVW
jgi:hypothetical protein